MKPSRAQYCLCHHRSHHFIVTDSQPLPESPKLSTVVVRGIGNNVPSQLVTLFFENKSWSGGGPIKHMDYVQGSGEAVVTFEDARGFCFMFFGRNNNDLLS